MSGDWRELNRRNWDERVAVHLASDMYSLKDVAEGCGWLGPIEEAELPPLDGKRIAHLQCHFGSDSLRLAQRGAHVVGLDFSAPAIKTAREHAQKHGLGGATRFVEADVYDAVQAIGEPGSFDICFVSWGTICWLPDLDNWARVIAELLRPGGSFHFFESHPLALVFDDETAHRDGSPGWFVPYAQNEPLRLDDPSDYADDTAQLKNSVTIEWQHPVSKVIAALMDAGLNLRSFNEHDGVPWAMFKCLVRHDDGLYRWPDKPWLPLSYSLQMTRPE